MAILKKPANQQQQQQQPPKGGGAPKGGGPKRDAFAEKLAQTQAAEGGNWTPPAPGTYNGLVTEAQMEEDGEKKNAYLEVTICEPDDDVHNGKTARIYFNFTDDNGEDKGGMPYFRQAMEMLGVDVEAELTSWDATADRIGQIAQEQPWVVIDVKRKGKWTNIYLSSVPEDQSAKPANPNE